MVQTTIAKDRLHSRRTVCVARILPGALLIFLSLAIFTHPINAHETEEDPSGTQPNFRFKPPRVIFGIRAGALFNRSNGEIYEFLEENLTLGDSSFDSGVFAMDVAVRAASRLDVVFGFEYSGSYEKSEFRNFEEASGAPIEQKTRLVQVPLTLSLKLYPFRRGRQVGDYAWIRSRVVLYLGGGIGGTYYQLKQKGDFVDFVDLTIFEAEIKSDGFVFSQHAFVGLDFKLTKNFGLVFEGRYHRADASLKDDFEDFDPIDLNGLRAMAGFNFRL